MRALSQVILDTAPTGPALQLDASGASQVTGPVGVDHLDIAESGASSLTLSGQVGTLGLYLLGTSQLLGTDLSVADLDASLSGASQADVTVSNTLAVTSSGAAELRYRGTPTVTRNHTSGISSVVAVSP
ncbi:MAG: GIN domain-containing protein [Pseudonocardiaceae bacterium]